MLDYVPILVTFALMFLNVPVAISLISGSLFYFAFITDTLPLTSVIQKLVSANMSSTLLAVPLFMMVGTVMNSAGITQRLMGLCDCLVGHKVGGLAHVNVLLSTLNGGICGSGGADAATQCKILVPEMSKRGYPLPFSAAVTAASGLIAPIIPPGAGLILYGVMTETSVGKMFMAGFVPGILMCALEMAIVSVIAHKNNFQPSRTTRATLGETVRAFVDSLWSVLIIVVLVIGIRMGVFTVSEGACLVVFLCLFVGLVVYKETKISQIPGMLIETFHGASSIMLMIIAATLFGMYLSWAHIPQNLAALMLTVTSSKFVFLFLSMILLLIFGMFLDGTAVLMIMTPLLWPVAQQFDVNAVHFGILLIVNTSIGSLTPPFGGVMYIVCKILKVSIPDFVKACWPFIVGLILLMFLLMAFPEIVLFLPNLVYG